MCSAVLAIQYMSLEAKSNKVIDIVEALQLDLKILRICTTCEVKSTRSRRMMTLYLAFMAAKAVLKKAYIA